MGSKWVVFGLVLVLVATAAYFLFRYHNQPKVVIANYDLIMEEAQRKVVDIGQQIQEMRKGESTAQAPGMYGIVLREVVQLPKVSVSTEKILQIKGRFLSEGEDCVALDAVFLRVLDSEGKQVASGVVNTLFISGNLKHSELLMEIRIPKSRGQYEVRLQTFPRTTFAQFQLTVE